MTRAGTIVLVCGFLVLHVLATAAAGQAVSRDQLKRQFESRYPGLVRLKEAGKVGETWEGFVAAVERRFEDDDEVRVLLREENDDRKALYRLLADAIGDDDDEDDARRAKVTPQVIAERNAWRNFQKATATEMLRVAEATWVTKKERPWLLELLKLEGKGRIGERGDGSVAAVGREDARDREVAGTVERENAARRALHERIAAEERLPVDRVAARQAKRRFTSAHAGAFIEAADGTWRRKREPSGTAPSG